MIQQQYEAMYCLEDTHWWFLAKQQYIKKIIPPPKKQLKILDVGCGTGGTSSFLEKWGNVTRLEPSPAAHKFLKKRKISFLPCSIQTYQGKPESFDAIFILDVLYHKNIKDDEEVLSKVYSLIKPGGFLCITDCAIPSLTSHHDQEMHARTRYTKRGLKKKVEASGFIVKRDSYMYCLVFPFFVIQRIIDKFSPIPTVARVPSALNSVLLSICSVGANILSFYNLPFGSSVILLAEKQLHGNNT